MWNDIDTGKYEGMIAETVSIPKEGNKSLNVYFSRPLSKESFPGIVLIPHMPGWDEFCRETARRLTQHGYAVACPDIYGEFGTGKPEEISVKMRNMGGVYDSSVMKDCQASINYLRSQKNSNGKVGIIGMCSGGRHAFLAACTVDGIDAAVDCWGGGTSMPKESLSEARPVAPIDFTKDLSCPLLGIFGNDDRMPTPPEVDELEEALKKYAKDYKFYRYDGAGHGMWYYHTPMYRQEQAMDSWEKVGEFFDKHLK